MVNTELIKKLLTRLKEDAEKGCELKSSDFSGKDTLNVDAAHDAILYCQERKHNDDTIFTDEHYQDDTKKNINYPGTSRHKSECVSKLEANVCYIRDSFSGVALKGYNNYLDSAGTPKIQEWHKYHFGNTIKTREEIGSGFTKNEDLLKNIKNYSTYLNFDKFIDSEYGLSGKSDGSGNHYIGFDDCILGLNFTWQAVLYYGYNQFLNNAKNCEYEIQNLENAKKIIECLRQINFVDIEDSVPIWKIGYGERDREIYKIFNVDDDNGPFRKMVNNGITNTNNDSPRYYFITSQSFIHSQISKIKPDNKNKGFEARNEGDEDSTGIGEVEMEQGIKELFLKVNKEINDNEIIDDDAKIMLWQFLKFQGDSSHLVFYSIIKVATTQSNPISIKVLTGERPLVKRAQLEGKTIVVRRFNVFTKYWPEAGSSDGTYIEFVADATAQAKTLLVKAVSLKQSEYYENWGDNLDSEITNLNDELNKGELNDSVNELKEKMKKFGKYIIEQKIQTYIGGDFKNDAEKFFKLMRPAKDKTLKPVRGAGGKQFDFGKDVDVVFSKLGFLADNYDTLDDETKKLLTIKEMMNGIEVGRRPPVDWVVHLQYIVNSFKLHEYADALLMDVNYKVLVLKPNSQNDLEIDIKGLTTFVSMNYYVMNDRSIFSSSSDSYQKVFFFAKILKFFIKEGKIQLPGQEEYFSGGGQQVGGNWYTRNATAEINDKYIGHYKNTTLKNMVKYLAEICRKIVELKQNNITDMDSIIQNHGDVLNPITKFDDRFVWQEIGIERSDAKGQTAESLRKKQAQIASFRDKYISLSEDSVLIPDQLTVQLDSKTKQLIWKSEQGESIPLKSPTPICTIVNEFSRIYNQVPKEGHDIKKQFQQSNVVKNDKYLKTLKENYESEISGNPINFISVKKEGAHIKWAKVEDNNDVGLDKEFVTYKQLLYEEALVRKFLDTVPSNISTNDELTTFINNNNAAHNAISANKSIEETLPNYNSNYPYTIWWLYSYINKGGGYEDFTDLFNSKITADTNNTKYYFVNETKFMEWKEKILSHEYNACIRYKYDYFLNGGVFQDYVSTTSPAAATAANTVNEFKIFTELEIKHLIVSTISLSGRFSDDNAILEDMEIVNLIQKELNKAGSGKNKTFADGNEKAVAKDLDIVIGETLTLDEVWTVEYETALKEGRVYDVSGDGAAEVLKPQKTVQQLSGDGETKKDIKKTLKEIIDKVFKNKGVITGLLNKVDK